MLPACVTTLGGLYEQQQIAFSGLLKVVAAAGLVFPAAVPLRTAALPLIIIGTSLLSTTAVFTGLWLTGIELNITAMMGMTMIIGIATEMAIFYVSEYRGAAPREAVPRALLEASRNRLRPIAMTTLAAILTLLPLALGFGEGSAMQQPLAVAIIAGLILQFPMVLLVMPTIYALLHGVGGIRQPRRRFGVRPLRSRSCRRCLLAWADGPHYMEPKARPWLVCDVPCRGTFACFDETGSFKCVLSFRW